MNESSASPLKKSSSLQFSLRSGFVALLCLAIAFAFISYNLRLRELRSQKAERERERDKFEAEVIALRAERGELTVKPADEDKIHLISVPSVESMTWRWRFYIPKGQALGVHSEAKTRHREIGKGPFPAGHSMWRPLQPGHHVLVISLRQDPRKQWEWLVRLDQQVDQRIPALDNATEWLEGTVPIGTRQAGQSGIEKSGVEQPVELFAYLVYPQSTEKDQSPLGTQAPRTQFAVRILNQQPAPGSFEPLLEPPASPSNPKSDAADFFWRMNVPIRLILSLLF